MDNTTCSGYRRNHRGARPLLHAAVLGAAALLLTPAVLQASSGSTTTSSGSAASSGSMGATGSTTQSSPGSAAAPGAGSTTAGSASGTFPDAIIRVDVIKVAQGYRASKLMGKDVENETGEDIGDINDLIINPADKITYAIIGVGGFLGIGERLVAVPFDALKPKQNSDNLILAGANKDRVRQLPEFKYRDR